MTILYCDCRYADLVPETRRRTVRAALAAAASDPATGRRLGRVEMVADLCEVAATQPHRLAEVVSRRDSPLHVIACYPRAVRWLFAFAGTPLPGAATVHNLRTDPAEVVLARLGLTAPAAAGPGAAHGPTTSAAETGTDVATARGEAAWSEAGAPGASALAASSVADSRADPTAEAPSPFPEKAPGEWVAWFPVIDYDRCRGCKQCAEFCLFGTYAVDEDGRVRVARPERCKLNCPACARVCPASAIIFPKFPDGGPIAGDAGTLGEAGEGSLADGLRTDLQRLGRGDVFETLRRRAEHARRAAEAKYSRTGPAGEAETDAAPSSPDPRRAGDPPAPGRPAAGAEPSPDGDPAPEEADHG